MAHEVEIGTLTLSEFLTLRNPQSRRHDEGVFDVGVRDLNHVYASPVGSAGASYGDRVRVEQVGDVYRVLKEEPHGRDAVLVGIIKDRVAYFDNPRAEKLIPRRVFSRGDSAPVDLPFGKTAQVKYLREIDPVLRPTTERFTEVLQRMIVDGESLKLVSEGRPKTNAGVTLAIVNEEGFVVAMASDEWGATLIRVAREYRNKGLGVALTKVWYRQNPAYGSGGFTPSGERNAARVWADRVRELSADGFYSRAVRSGEMTRARVREILSALPRAPERRAAPKPAERDKSASTKPEEIKRRLSKGEILVYFDGVTFIVYDRRFLDEQDERFIHGFGFFRDAERIGSFLFRIEYDRPYAGLTTRVALQAARDEGERLYVGGGYNDLVEYEGIDGVERRGDYLYVERDLLPLEALSKLEQAMRKPRDPYREIYASLVELAESKWD